MNRLVAGLFVLSLLFACDPRGGRIEYLESDIETLEALMQQGELSSRQLTQYYLDRIEDIDRSGPTLISIIEVNPPHSSRQVTFESHRWSTGKNRLEASIPSLNRYGKEKLCCAAKLD